MPDFRIERAAGEGPIAGIDEAGRGPLAGPVVAAAVVLDVQALPRAVARRIDDSKLLEPGERAELFTALRNCAAFGIGSATVEEIDRLNILQATLLAMRRATEKLPVRPAQALVDGNVAPQLDCPVRTVVNGDGLSLSIAAASIVAKVTRDRLMAALACCHPGYGWQRNAGYGTAEHKQALVRLGITPYHRRSFRPIYEILALND